MKKYLILLPLLFSNLFATDLFVLCTCMKSGTWFMRNVLETTTGRTPYCHGKSGSDKHFGFCHTPGGIRENCKVIYLHRDPRDVLISYAHWGPKRRTAHNWFKERTEEVRAMNIKQRVMYLLDLSNPCELSHSLPDVVRRVQEAKNNPNRFISLSYEEVIGLQGGGSEKSQFEAFNRLHAFLNIKHITVAELVDIAKKTYGHSASFRRGKIGKWTEVFDDELKAAFKASPYGDFVVKLGYEKDNNW